MEIFNIGLPELILIFLLMLVLLGPKGMIQAGYKLGAFLRKVIKSPLWSSLMSASREIREIPNQIVKESGLDKDLAELRRSQAELKQLPKSFMRESGLQEELEEIRREASVDIKNEPDNGSEPSKPVEPPAPEVHEEQAAAPSPADENAETTASS